MYVRQIYQLHHQCHRLVEVKESLQALYHDNDSSSFQHLLGFSQPVEIFNEVEFKIEEVDVFTV